MLFVESEAWFKREGSILLWRVRCVDHLTDRTVRYRDTLALEVLCRCKVPVEECY